MLNRRSALLKNFILNGQESASNPLLQIHAKRYAESIINEVYMKPLKRFVTFLLILIVVGFIGCQPKEEPQLELEKVDKVFRSYFDAISNFDYQAMRNACSSDYILLEDGIYWSVEDHINFLKPFEGKASITYNFYDVKQSIDGPVAWRTHRNVADATIDGKPMNFEWLESAVFHRQNNEWKLAVLHSTPAKLSQEL